MLMAMNKKEKLHVESLENEIRVLQRTIDVMLADRTTKAVLPDLDYPTSFELVKGYSFNTSGGTVSKSCSSVTGHNRGSDEKTQPQNPIRQYSTELLAYQGLRYEVEQKWLQQLADIDKIIQKLQKETV
jgi:hypothetical protein